MREEKERLRIQDKTFISRERKKIRKQVQLRLLRHFLPVPCGLNVLASTRSNMIDMFLEEFLKTFELHLEQMTPYILAASMLNEEGARCLDQLDAIDFAPRSTV